MTFDPNFPMMPGMRYPAPIPGHMPPVPISADEGLEVDEHGNVNWRLAWLKEIGHLQQITAEQEKANIDPEWYRMMLFRVRTALMPPMSPDMIHAMAPPHMQPPQPNPGDMQQGQQQSQ
jgi:forkhead box protein J2/3